VSRYVISQLNRTKLAKPYMLATGCGATCYFYV